MKVRDVMSRDVQIVDPNQTIREAAEIMKGNDIGLLPVAEGDRLVGMITDRDIAIRGIAEGKGQDAKIRAVMTQEVKYCFDDEDVEHVCDNLAELQVRRLPVMDRNKRLVGIISLGDIATEGLSTPAGQALHSISQPGGAHCQAGRA